MKALLLTTLFLLDFSAYANIESELMVQYQQLHPYHTAIKEPMPVQRCEPRSIKHGRAGKNHCWLEIEYESNPEKMHAVLKRTRQAFDTADPEFLSSDLGKEYSHLNRFIELYEKMEKCKSNQAAGSEETQLMLERFEEGASEAVSVAACTSCHTKNLSEGEEIFSSFINFNKKEKPLEEAEFQDQIFSKALETSIQSRVLMESQFNPENFKSPNFADSLTNELCQKQNDEEGEKNPCREEDKTLLKSLIDEAKKNTAETPEKQPNIVKNVNQHISHLNNILREYNSQRNDILKQKRKEKEALPQHITSRPAHYKIDMKYAAQLKRLKESVFREYQSEIAPIYNMDTGRILRTSAIHEASGFSQLEEINSKLLGIHGFEESILTNEDTFPLLKPIGKTTAERALNESFLRSNQLLRGLLNQNQKKLAETQEYQNQRKNAPSLAEKRDLDAKYRAKRIKDIEDFILFHPHIISQFLVKDPKRFPIICKAAASISSNRKRKKLIKNNVTLVGAVGVLSIAVAAPFLGFVGLPVMLAVTGAALTSSTADYILRTRGASEHQQLKEKMLNAYLSETGDTQSINEIRSEWRKALAEDLHARWAIGFGLFDITRTGTAIRQTLIHSTGKAKRSAAAQITKNRILLFNISQNRAHEEALITLLGTQSNLEVRRFLRAVTLFPPNKQRTILSELPHMASNPNLNLVQLTSELKKRGIRANLSSFLLRYTRCVNCKAKPGIKLQKGAQEPPSG